jgi:hypothetical protein
MKLAMKILKPIMVLAFVIPLLPSLTFAQYIRTDLVSNQTGVAPNTDAHLINGWGLVQLGTSPFWVSDNGTGFSTLYTGTGAPPIDLFVSIPPAPGSPAGTLGTPTGVVGNGSPTDFTITESGTSGPALFIFATLDGTISGWILSLTAPPATLMPLSRPPTTCRASLLYTQGWPSQPTTEPNFYTPPMMARTGELTCSTQHLPL